MIVVFLKFCSKTLFCFRQDSLAKLSAEVVFEDIDGESVATIPLLDLEKNSTRKKVRGFISLKSFPEQSLDPVFYLRAYLNRTCEARVSYIMKHGNAPAGLFIAISAPHQPVLPCTLAKWLLAVMQNSGIDVTVYKAHSTRSAGAAHMKTHGMSLKQVLDRGFWSKREGTSKVFKKFYQKPLE